MADPTPALPDYAELCALSHFSFQRGASSPAELVERAHALGYGALAITDECSMAGVVRAHQAAQATGLKLLIGTTLEVTAPDTTGGTFTLVLLARQRTGYGQLCELVTAARATGVRGQHRYRLTRDTGPLASAELDDTLALLLPPREASDDDLLTLARWAAQRFTPQRAWLGVRLTGRLDDHAWAQRLEQAGTLSGLRLTAVGRVLMHRRSRKPLQDVMTAIRLGRPVTECGYALEPNAEAHLLPRLRLAQRHRPEWLAETLRIASQCDFQLNELRYEYPDEIVPTGHTPASYLRQLADEGALQRYPEGLPDDIRAQMDTELALIAQLRYEPYFLTVYDVVRFARSQNILCQGRGSAANSVVCYCLGITEVDPTRSNLLFARFISAERNEPPDIDVDFEHDRREEVIQYLYDKYGRERAALAAALSTYHARGAIRDVGKALGIAPEVVDQLARHHQWWDGHGVVAERVRELGLDPDAPRLRWLFRLCGELVGFPRHLSQHSGGFVLTRGRLTSTVPVVPAAMPGRTTIEWDKDDLDAVGLLKVDVLALGMLSALRRAMDYMATWRGGTWTLHNLPAEDPATYEMMCRADTVGVFQIESRAQMSMLPRLQPRCFYDLVVEVAIVRPGPIQGGMVHPYLQRRELLRNGGAITYPKDALKPALERTLGIPIFQEQVMQIAMIAADFTPGEADALRRSMAAWRRRGGVDRFKTRLIEGMVGNDYKRDFAEAIFRQIEGFGEYGFPESHAASFALLVYASAWIKCHEPACFLAALLNSQPMGFYRPPQLVQDARRHGVEVRPVDVNTSDWDATLERPSDGGPNPAVRLGLGLVKHLTKAGAGRLVAARASGPFTGTEDLALRARLDAADLRALAAADALHGLAGHRRQQLWQASAQHAAPPLLREAPVDEDFLSLPAAAEGEDVLLDYTHVGLTLRRHPLALLRPWLAQRRLLNAEQLAQCPDGRLVRACGLVTTRQQPGTAKGVVFVTLEDETGSVQVIVWPDLKERQRTALTGSRLLAVHGRWQRQSGVSHLVAGHLLDLSPLLGKLPTVSRDFH